MEFKGFFPLVRELFAMCLYPHENDPGDGKVGDTDCGQGETPGVCPKSSERMNSALARCGVLTSSTWVGYFLSKVESSYHLGMRI